MGNKRLKYEQSPMSNGAFSDVNDAYMTLVKRILDYGVDKDDRTGAGTRSLFGEHLKIDVSQYAPFITLKRIPLKSTIGELLWFLEGTDDARKLTEKYNCNFWEEWIGYETPTIGPIYGEQWRNFNNTGHDQLRYVIDELISNNQSRRMVVSAWNPLELPNPHKSPNKNADEGRMALAPCHFAWQVNCRYDKETGNIFVDLQWYQRSADVFLGLPVNIASYFILLRILCDVANTQTSYLPKAAGVYKPGTLSVSLGDAHIYKNHEEQITELVRRYENGEHFKSPRPKMANNFIRRNYLLEHLDDDTLGREMQQSLYEAIVDYHPLDVIRGVRNV